MGMNKYIFFFIKKFNDHQKAYVNLNLKIQKWKLSFSSFHLVPNNSLNILQAAAEIEQNLTALRTSRKAAAWLEKSDLMRIIAKEVQV